MSKLYKKIHAVMNEIGTISKKGYNSFHKYKYATEADYVEALRPLLKKHGLTVTPKIIETPKVVSNEKGDYLTTILIEFKLTDIDTGESDCAIVAGQGTDKGDKGIYKALTGAKKYWASLTFMVDTGDDPERDTGKSYSKKSNSNFKRKVSTDEEF